MNTQLPKVQLYSDWWAVPNPWKAGYGIILCYKDIKKEFKQGYTLSTNNRMEMTGVITWLSKLKTQSQVDVYTDSQYTINGIEKWWAKKWKSNDWMRTKSQKAVNYDLWEKLLDLTEKHQVTFHWVKWHNWHIENERCDELATLALNSNDLIEDEGFDSSKISPLLTSPQGRGITQLSKEDSSFIENTPKYILDLARWMRKSWTEPEKIMWEILRRKQIEWIKFRRQHPFWRYIADFYSDKLKLVVELDWEIHKNQVEYDKIRDEIISQYWVHILRIQNNEVLNNIEWVIAAILSPLGGKSPEGHRGINKVHNKISSTWDVCWKCNTPVIKKIPKKKKLKSEQKYYYEYFLFCPWCKTNYMIPEWKREVIK